jgi:spore photoproduct lyase
MSGDRFPNDLVVEAALEKTSLARTLLDRFPTGRVVGSIRPADYAGYPARTLVLARHPGRFVKPCPGTKGYLCCGLQIIHLGLGCSLGCTYCILQGYLDTPALVVFGNVEEGLEEVRRRLESPGRGPRRYCTGEFTDSLLLEDLTGWSARLIKLFAGYPRALLELKTKTDRVESLLGLDHGGRTVVSFSVNALEVSRLEEAGADPLAGRIAAASRAVQAGYRVGFHFDPLIRHPGWQEGYARTVSDLFAAVPAERMAWISLGAFRYLPRLGKIIPERHPGSRIVYDEFVQAPDGKHRYLRPLRVEMYRALLGFIREAGPDVPVYLCMESRRVWHEVFGFDPGPGGLAAMLEARV